MNTTSVSAAGQFLRRFHGALVLDVAVYEEVEADHTANGQALAVVLMSSVAAGFGARGFAGGNPVSIVVFGAIALVAWGAWALLTYQIGVNVLQEPQTQADMGQLLRTTGFAAAPGVFCVLGALSGFAAPVFGITAVWMLATMVVGVRQALDYTSTRRALAVCGLGWGLAIVFAVTLGLFFGPRVS